MTTNGRTAKVAGSSSMDGYSGAQCAGGSSCVPTGRSGSLVGRFEAVGGKGVGPYRLRVRSVGANVERAKPRQTGTPARWLGQVDVPGRP